MKVEDAHNTSLIQSLIEYAFAILTVLQCNSVFFREMNHNSTIINTLWQFVLLILFVESIGFITKSNFNNYRLFIFLIIFFIIILSFLFIDYLNFHYNIIFFFMLFLFDPIMLIVVFYSYLQSKDSAEIFYKIENVVLIFAVISLIFWVIVQIGLQPNVSVMTHWNSAKATPGYFYLYFTSTGYRKILGLSIIRNSGIFVEAPMYSYVLSIALLIELFLKRYEETSIRNVFILFVTILSTFSTTGVLISISALFYFYFLKSRGHNYKILLLCFIPFILVLFKFILSSKVGSSDIQQDKLSSAWLRMDDFHASIMAWKNHLFIGNGLNNVNAIIKYMNPGRLLGNIPATGLSLGFTTALAFGGIILGLYYIIPTLLSLRISLNVFGLALFSFVLFTVVIVNDSYFYIVLLSYLWMLIICTNKNSKTFRDRMR